MLGVEFFDGIEAADPKFLTAEGLAFNVNLPPLFIVTCGDDFLEPTIWRLLPHWPAREPISNCSTRSHAATKRSATCS